MSDDGGRSAVMSPAAVAQRRVRDSVAWLPALVGVVIGLAVLYGPVLRELVGVWSRVTYYSYCFLIAPWSAWLGLGSRRQVAAVPFRRDFIGLAVAGAGLGVLAFADVVDSLTLAALSLPIVLVGLGRFALGREAFRPLVFPVAFLAFMAPLPPTVVPVLSWHLQHLAAWFTTIVLRALGIPFWREDVLIHLGRATVHISEACNGLRFLLAMAVVGVAFGWASGRGSAGRVLIAGLALGTALVGNVTRVAGTTVLVHVWGPAASLGLFHNVFGKTVYVAVLALFLLVVLRFRARDSPLPVS